jgi:cytoskeleton protein RodZ
VDIGKALKEAREMQNISLEQVEEETKIRRKYLQALENEQYDILPGQVYAKAFLKSYAKFLNLNVEEVMAAYAQVGLEEIPTEQENSKSNIEKSPMSAPPKSLTRSSTKSRTKSRTWLYLGTILAAIALLISALYFANAQKRNQLPQPPDGEQAAQSGEQPAAQEPTTKQTEGVTLTFNVVKDSCWMRVVVDGTPAFQGELQAGQTQEFTGKENISFTLGNAGVVQVELNGEELGYLGDEGAVINREFTAHLPAKEN